MGCTASSKLSEEEVRFRREVDAFRAKVIKEVSANRLRSVVVNQSSWTAGRSTLDGGDTVLSANGRSSAEAEPSLAGNRHSLFSMTSGGSSGGGGGGESSDMMNYHSSTRPLRTMSHVEQGTLLMGDNLVQHSGDMTVSIPGKVGCEDDKIVISAGSHAHMLFRTRRVHKHKRGVKKAIANRRMTNLEKEDCNQDLATPSASEGSRPLDQAERRSMLKVLQNHFLTAPLLKEEHSMLIEQVVRLELALGDAVCTKGEKGDCCFVMLSGTCSVSSDKAIQLSAGHFFGEIAMLYDVPRTATIVCSSSRVVVGKIKGPSFRRCLARFKERTLNQTLGFLNEHELFSKLSLEEKRIFANALTLQHFEVGAMVIDEKMSRSADWMFLVQEGDVEITDQYKNRKVLTKGATFSGQKMPYGQKAVSAKAISKLQVLSIGHSVMNRLFGNISEILRRATVRHLLLNQVRIFRDLTDRQQMTMAALFQEQHFAKGEVIVTAMADPQLALVLEGEVLVVDPSPPMARSEAGAQDEPGALAACPNCPAREPEVELPHTSLSSHRRLLKEKEEVAGGEGSDRSMKIARRLGSGDVYGEGTFGENCCMEHSLVASTDALVCRAGHDEVCQALRGAAEKTPPLSRIILRNRIKGRLQQTFPFSALYEEMLDVIVEAFETVEYQKNETMVPVGDRSRRFFFVVEGEALKKQGFLMKPLSRWSCFGIEQVLLDQLVADYEIVASATGCLVKAIGTAKLREACGVLFGEMATKTKYRDLNIKPADCIRLGKLGHGQFGVVRKVAVRGIFGETFALKRISKRKVLETGQQMPVRLEKEILDECCHPLIVRLVATFQDEHSVYILMENCSGGDLFTAIRDIGVLNEEQTLFFGAVLNEEQTLFFGASIVLAVEYLHARGFMYRDLKPENVMLEANGFIKLVDMGCCSRKARSYTFVGTPEYMAPEVVTGKGYTQAVDWWSVGIIMYEMICGPLPFGEGCSDELEVMREVCEKPLGIPPTVAPDAADLLTSLLERTPEQRLGSSTFQTASEVRDHHFFDHLCWDAILEHGTLPPYSPPKPKGASQKIVERGYNRAGTTPLTSSQEECVEVSAQAKQHRVFAALHTAIPFRGKPPSKPSASDLVANLVAGGENKFLNLARPPPSSSGSGIGPGREAVAPTQSERPARALFASFSEASGESDDCAVGAGDEVALARGGGESEEESDEEELPLPPDLHEDVSCFEGF